MIAWPPAVSGMSGKWRECVEEERQPVTTTLLSCGAGKSVAPLTQRWQSTDESVMIKWRNVLVTSSMQNKILKKGQRKEPAAEITAARERKWLR